MYPSRFMLLRMLALCGTCFFSNAAFPASHCEADGWQTSGSIYRICMPDAGAYNGRLIIWAHGFQDANTPLGIPEDQLNSGGQSIQEYFNNLGFSFATNSYSKTGLAVRQGMEDILDLVKIYTAAKGAPEKIYLIGASEGGLITTLLLEQHPEVFDGGLAACGPVGDFSYQIRHIGDARATFDYFFTGLIPGAPFRPAPDLIARWPDFYQSPVKPFITDWQNRALLNQWIRVAKLPDDARQPAASRERIAKDVLHYAVMNLNEAADTLGGFPFNNLERRYTGSRNNRMLNDQVPRITADPVALAEMKAYYNTSGQLQKPLITLHSTGDWLVPYRHEALYIKKTRASDSYRRQHMNIKTNGHGHCAFRQEEVLFAVAMLGVYTHDTAVLTQLARNLQIPSLRREFRNLAARNNIRVDFPNLHIRVKLPGGIVFPWR